MVYPQPWAVSFIFRYGKSLVLLFFPGNIMAPREPTHPKPQLSCDAKERDWKKGARQGLGPLMLL